LTTLLEVGPTTRAPVQNLIFRTDDGKQFTHWGWTSMARRIGERMREAGFNGFMQHRARGSTAKLLQRRGVPLNVIQQIGGWKVPEMVRRYIGDYSVEELKTFPKRGLDQVATEDWIRQGPHGCVATELPDGVERSRHAVTTSHELGPSK